MHLCVCLHVCMLPACMYLCCLHACCLHSCCAYRPGDDASKLVMFEWSSQQQQLRRLGDVSINNHMTSGSCGMPVSLKLVPRCPTGEYLLLLLSLLACCCYCCYCRCFCWLPCTLCLLLLLVCCCCGHC